MGRAHAVVDVEPVRLGGHRDDLGAGPGVALGGDGRGGPVRAVDDDPQAGQRLRRVGEQVRDVAVVGAGLVADTADGRSGRAGGRVVEALLDSEARARRAACGRLLRTA